MRSRFLLLPVCWSDGDLHYRTNAHNHYMAAHWIAQTFTEEAVKQDASLRNSELPSLTTLKQKGATFYLPRPRHYICSNMCDIVKAATVRRQQTGHVAAPASFPGLSPPYYKQQSNSFSPWHRERGFEASLPVVWTDSRHRDPRRGPRLRWNPVR